MSTSATFNFIVPNYGRSISDDGWEEIDREHMNLWETATKTLSSIERSTKTHTYKIAFDWTPIFQKHKKHYEAMKRFERNKAQQKHPFQGVQFPRSAARVPITVTAGDGGIPRSVAECAIYDIFLIMNLAAPGSCDFYRSSLPEPRYANEVSLGNYYFEAAFQRSRESKDWPNLRMLELAQVVGWFNNVRTGLSQVPENPMERTLFALWNISSLDTSPMSVIWLFYAFESLLETKAGENFGAITSRLKLLLNLDRQQEKAMKKGMRDLYDIRSAIVHGGLQVWHPSHSSNLDSRVDDSYTRVLFASDIGFALLIAAIQETIMRGWKYPIFHQALDGASMG